MLLQAASKVFAFEVPRKARTHRSMFASLYYLLILGVMTYYIVELVSKHRYVVKTTPQTFLVTNTFNSDFVVLPTQVVCNNPELNVRSSAVHCFNSSSCLWQTLADRVTSENGRISVTLSYAGSDGNGCLGYFLPQSDVTIIFQHGFIHPETNEIYKPDECTIRTSCTDPDRCMERIENKEMDFLWKKDEKGEFKASMAQILSTMNLNYGYVARFGAVLLIGFSYDSHRDWELGSKIKCYVNQRLLPGTFATGSPTYSVDGHHMNKAGNFTSGYQTFLGRDGQGTFTPMRVQFVTQSTAVIGVDSGYAVVMHLISMTVMFGLAFTIVQFLVVRLENYEYDVLDLDVKQGPPTEWTRKPEGDKE